MNGRWWEPGTDSWNDEGPLMQGPRYQADTYYSPSGVGFYFIIPTTVLVG